MKKTMKSPIYFIRILSLLVAALFAGGTLQAQENEDKYAALIKGGEFIFRAQAAMPTTGNVVQLTTPYDVMFSKDSARAFLPYFGRVFNAPYGGTDGGIKFTSTDFDYNVKERRKGGWQIRLRPEDTREVRELFMTVSEEGYATLQVTSNNRQTIAYRGRIEARR